MLNELGRWLSRSASNKDEVAAAQERERLRQIDDDAALLWILSDPRGRRVLGQLLYETCGVNRLSHLPEAATQTAFNEGARNVGLQLLAKVQSANHQAFLLLLQERRNDEIEFQAATDLARPPQGQLADRQPVA